MPYVKDTYTPSGYNADLYHNKKVLATGLAGRVNAIVTDSMDKGNAFIIGSFYSASIFGFNTSGVVKFSAYTNSFTPYPSNFSQGSNIKCMLQASNGKHYFGGDIYNGSSTFYFVRKAPAGTIIEYLLPVNARANDIQEVGTDIVFTGDFGQYGAGPCAPILAINTASNGTPAGFGGYAYTGSQRMAYMNGEWFLSNQNVQGYIISSTGGNWLTAYGGFNNYCSDMVMYKGELYASGSMTKNSNNLVSLQYVNKFSFNSWYAFAANNLPGPCLDLEVYNGRLYALGYNYIYCHDPNDNKWKSAIEPSLITLNYATMFKFLNGKIYVVENNEFLELSK